MLLYPHLYRGGRRERERGAGGKRGSVNCDSIYTDDCY